MKLKFTKTIKLTLCAILLLSCLPSQAQLGTPKQLNRPAVLFGDVFDFVISPDGQWVGYIADQDTDEVLELYVVPIDDSSAPIKLNDTLPAGGDISSLIFSDGQTQRIIFLGQQESLARELFSVPIDGSASPIKISTAVPDGFIDEYFSTASGSRVVYHNNKKIYVTDPSSGNPVLRKPAPVHNSSINGMSFGNFSQIIYISDADDDNVFEVYSLALTGDTDPVKLNQPLPTNGDVAKFIIATNNRVLYLADEQAVGVFNWHSVPFMGGQQLRLSDNASVSPSFIYGAFFSNLAIYGANPNNGFVDIISTPLTGGSKTNITTGINVEHTDRISEVSQDGNWFIYSVFDLSTFSSDLYIAATDGSTPPRKVNESNIDGGRVFSATFSKNGQHIIYRADHNVDGVSELFRAPVTSGESPIVISLELPDGESITSFDKPVVSSDSTYVIYQTFSGEPPSVIFRSYFSTLDGRVKQKIHNTLPFMSSIGSARLASDSRHIVFGGDQDVLGEVEIYSVSVDPITLDFAADEEEQLCVPIKTLQGSISVICL